jgi:hypothetical protein
MSIFTFVKNQDPEVEAQVNNINNNKKPKKKKKKNVIP